MKPATMKQAVYEVAIFIAILVMIYYVYAEMVMR